MDKIGHPLRHFKRGYIRTRAFAEEIFSMYWVADTYIQSGLVNPWIAIGIQHNVLSASQWRGTALNSENG